MPPPRSLFPRSKKARRRIEFLGGAMIGVFAALIGVSFLYSALFGQLLRSPYVAAVVSAVLVDLANQDRVEAGVHTLTVNPLLVAAAQAKANDMVSKGYFAHVSPDGVDPWHWFNEAGYSFAHAGENLAVDFSDSGDVNAAWMNSPEHRNNMLDPRYTEIGIATAQGTYQGRLTTFVVQEFGSPPIAIASEGTPAHESALQQAVIDDASIPQDPTIIATAHTEPQVLGSETTRSAPTPTIAEQHPPAIAKAIAPTNMPTLPVANMAGKQTTHSAATKPWQFIFGFPRTAIHYVYYALGTIVLAALALDTGFEMHRRHRKRAIRALVLLVAMAILLLVADTLFFIQPTLAMSVG